MMSLIVSKDPNGNSNLVSCVSNVDYHTDNDECDLSGDYDDNDDDDDNDDNDDNDGNYDNDDNDDDKGWQWQATCVSCLHPVSGPTSSLPPQRTSWWSS